MKNKRRLPQAAFAHLLVLGLISSQTVLPFLHDAQVAIEEAEAHPAWGRAPADQRLSSGAPAPHGHSHHDPSSCPVDRFLSQGRLGLSPDAASEPTISLRADFIGPDPSVRLASGPSFGGASPRAPPQLS